MAESLATGTRHPTITLDLSSMTAITCFRRTIQIVISTIIITSIIVVVIVTIIIRDVIQVIPGGPLMSGTWLWLLMLMVAI